MAAHLHLIGATQRLLDRTDRRMPRPRARPISAPRCGPPEAQSLPDDARESVRGVTRTVATRAAWWRRTLRRIAEWHHQRV